MELYDVCSKLQRAYVEIIIQKHEKIKTFFRHNKAFFLELYDVCSKL
jgi:hypothetical protein